MPIEVWVIDNRSYLNMERFLSQQGSWYLYPSLTSLDYIKLKGMVNNIIASQLLPKVKVSDPLEQFCVELWSLFLSYVTVPIINYYFLTLLVIF